jgi:hypothetical protein
MTTKEKIVRQAIAKATKEVDKIRALLSANPIGRICEIRLEAQKILIEHGDDHQTIAKLIKPLGEEEKRMFALAEKQKDTMGLMDRQCALEHELYDLGTELYYIKQRRR